MRQPIESAKDVAKTTGQAITKTASFITSSFVGLGRGVFKTTFPSTATGRQLEPGAAPGIEHYIKTEDTSVPIEITVIDYGSSGMKTQRFPDIDSALQHPRAPGTQVRWINVDGLRPSTIDSVGQHYGLHTLSEEDVLNTYQRPKVEAFNDHIFIVARQLRLTGDTLKNEQISFFLFSDTLITFQEEPGDVFDPVRKRIQNGAGRFYKFSADYLFYALLDSIVDHLFPILEAYGAALEGLEEEIMEEPKRSSQQRLFAMKRDLSLQRRTLWPIREVVDQLYRDESPFISGELNTFFRDVQDHCMQILDLLETYRDTAYGLSDLYQSSVGNKMNEIMKLLTIMASFFIPITFLAGVYGMNFEHIPELQWRYAYPTFWTICLLATAGLGIFFWRRGWIGPNS